MARRSAGRIRLPRFLALALLRRLTLEPVDAPGMQASENLDINRPSEMTSSRSRASFMKLSSSRSSMRSIAPHDFLEAIEWQGMTEVAISAGHGLRRAEGIEDRLLGRLGGGAEELGHSIGIDHSDVSNFVVWST